MKREHARRVQAQAINEADCGAFNAQAQSDKSAEKEDNEHDSAGGEEGDRISALQQMLMASE